MTAGTVAPEGAQEDEMILLYYNSGIVSKYPRFRRPERAIRRELLDAGERRTRIIETWSGGKWDVAAEDTISGTTTYWILK
jgi:hypothetical protein